jgi:hypothetical protein
MHDLKASMRCNFVANVVLLLGWFNLQNRPEVEKS